MVFTQTHQLCPAAPPSDGEAWPLRVPGDMQTPLQITFRDIPPTESIESYVRARAEKLGRFSDRITGCHVTIESPHRHKRHGRHHSVRIDLVVPGNELVVTRDPAERTIHEDLYASIGCAFDDAERMLTDHVRTQRRFERVAIGERVPVEEAVEQGSEADEVARTG